MATRKGKSKSSSKGTTSPRTIEKAHEIARAIIRDGSNSTDNPYAVGMAAAQEGAAKRKRSRKARHK